MQVIFGITNKRLKLTVGAIFIVAMYFPVAALADVCPQKGEKLSGTPYRRIIECPVGSLIIAGRKNPAKYQSCLGDVPISDERVSIKRKNGQIEVLPSVRNLAGKNDEFDREKTWVVTKVECKDRERLVVTYWGGGNCDKCEKNVEYLFDKRGRLGRADIE